MKNYNESASLETHSKLARGVSYLTAPLNVFTYGAIFLLTILICSLSPGKVMGMDQVQIAKNVGFVVIIFGSIGFRRPLLLCEFKKTVLAFRLFFITVFIGISVLIGVYVFYAIPALISFSLFTAVRLNTRLTPTKDFNTIEETWTAVSIVFVGILIVIGIHPLWPDALRLAKEQPFSAIELMFLTVVGLPSAIVAFRLEARSFLACMASSIILQLPCIAGLLSALMFIVFHGLAILSLCVLMHIYPGASHLIDKYLGGIFALLDVGADSLCLFMVLIAFVGWCVVGSVVGSLFRRALCHPTVETT